MYEISLDGLNDFTKFFWNYVKDAKVFAFHGAMGAGKTTIIEALCKAKGVQDAMGSPTFSIINEYAYRQHNTTGVIYHIDLYRLKDEEEILQAGVEDCIYSQQICFVEWPQKAANLFDENTVHVFVETISESQRSMKIELPPYSMEEQS